jgi:probable HAF family extracellular repeat protein
MSLRRVLSGHNVRTLCRIALAVTLTLGVISLPYRFVREATCLRHATARPSYRIEEIALPGYRYTFALGLSDSGAIVGVGLNDGDSPLRPFVWKSGKASPLPLPAGSENNVAVDINRRGEIIGASLFPDGHVDGVLWSGGKMTLLKVPGDGVYPYGINGNGQIVGVHQEPRCGAPPTAFLWQQGRFTDIGNFFAIGVNGDATVAGAGYVDGSSSYPDALLWRSGKGVQWLAKPRGFNASLAYGLNSEAQVTGAVLNIVDQRVEDVRAVVWEGGKPRLLSKNPSMAVAINDRRQIVGQAVTRDGDVRPCLWEGGRETPLSSMMPHDSPWQLVTATQINARGQIAGVGIHNDTICGYLLTPER